MNLFWQICFPTELKHGDPGVAPKIESSIRVICWFPNQGGHWTFKHIEFELCIEKQEFQKHVFVDFIFLNLPSWEKTHENKKDASTKLQDLMNQPSDWESNWPKWVHKQAWKNGVPYAPCNNSLPECIKRRKRHVAIFQMYWAFGYHSTGPFLDAIHMRYTPLNYSECFQETTCFFFQVMLAVWRT